MSVNIQFLRRGNSGAAIVTRTGAVMPDLEAFALQVDNMPVFDQLEQKLKGALDTGSTIREIKILCANFIESFR